MTTPLAVDQFSRYMIELFDEREIIGATTVFQTFFGNPAHSGSKTVFENNSEVISIDIVRGNEEIAALIHRGTNSTHLGDLEKKNKAVKWTNFNRQFPLAEEQSSVNATQLLKRLPGEGPYSGRTRVDRLRQLAIDYRKTHIRKFVRLFEVLAGTSLLTGQQPALLGTSNSDMIYDFRRNSGNTISPTIAWDATGADIMGDLDGACDILRVNGHVQPNVVLMGGDATDALVKDSTIKSLADNRRYELILISDNNPVPANLSRLVTAGAEAIGRLRTTRGRNLWLFTYNDVYTDSTGTAQKYMPEDKALIAFYGARCDRYFGPPEILPITSQDAAWYQEVFGFNMLAPPMPTLIKDPGAVIMPEMFTDYAEQISKQKIKLATQTAPIFATTQTDAFVVLENLIDGEES